MSQAETEAPEEREMRPNWKRHCSVCGQAPIVDLYLNGKLTDSTDMCGACTFGEAECWDPENW